MASPAKCSMQSAQDRTTPDFDPQGSGLDEHRCHRPQQNQKTRSRARPTAGLGPTLSGLGSVGRELRVRRCRATNALNSPNSTSLEGEVRPTVGRPIRALIRVPICVSHSEPCDLAARIGRLVVAPPHSAPRRGHPRHRCAHRRRRQAARVRRRHRSRHRRPRRRRRHRPDNQRHDRHRHPLCASPVPSMNLQAAFRWLLRFIIGGVLTSIHGERVSEVFP